MLIALATSGALFNKNWEEHFEGPARSLSIDWPRIDTSCETASRLPITSFNLRKREPGSDTTYLGTSDSGICSYKRCILNAKTGRCCEKLAGISLNASSSGQCTTPEDVWEGAPTFSNVQTILVGGAAKAELHIRFTMSRFHQ
jgi:hypothetical protein